MFSAAFIDRLANRALIALCVVHLALFFAFALSLAWAARSHAAEPAACHGSDLTDRLAREAPARLAEAERQARATPNGNGLLWKVTADNGRPSYLFGTMHSADPRIAELPEAARAAFTEADTVLIETTETLDPANAVKAMAELSELTLLAEGERLSDWVEPENRESLREAVTARGMPLAAADRLQPWLVAASIANPLCELAAKQAGKPVLDARIGLDAREAGKKLVGLETIEEQFRAIAAVPRAFHVAALNETLRLGALADDLMETTKLLYLSGRTAMVLPLIRVVSPETYRGKGNAEFRQLLVTRRNAVMAERAAPHLEKGGAFMAVGALHLPGEDGLVELLRAEGFTVTAVPG